MPEWLPAGLPVAHVGHYLWALYLPPVLIVLGSIVRSVVVERRKEREKNFSDSQKKNGY